MALIKYGYPTVMVLLESCPNDETLEMLFQSFFADYRARFLNQHRVGHRIVDYFYLKHPSYAPTLVTHLYGKLVTVWSSLKTTQNTDDSKSSKSLDDLLPVFQSKNLPWWASSPDQ